MALLQLEVTLCRRIQLIIKISLWKTYFSRDEWYYPITHVSSDPSFRVIQVACIVCHTGKYPLLTSVTEQQSLMKGLTGWDFMWAVGLLVQGQQFVNSYMHVSFGYNCETWNSLLSVFFMINISVTLFHHLTDGRWQTQSVEGLD